MLSALSGFLSFLLIAAVAVMIGLIWSEQRMREPGPLAADKVLYIVPGTDVPEIISELEHEGIIDSPFALNVALLVEGNRSKVKAGEYLFKQGASLREVMDTLVSGKQVLHAITIPEGLTTQQIVERLQENDVLIGDVRDLPKEGTLMPDTYKVVRGASRADLIRKMQDDQKKVVDQIWARRANNLPLHSPYELVTLASIVEKETGKADERSRVASVFMNRLAKRMRLQSDPTIVYGLVGGKGTLGRGITRVELEKPTPYNTYMIDGLPPGPIANPGRAALEAVANPSRTQDLYFVADGTGGHVFAETLDQHARNVQRWRQIEKDAKDKAGAAGADVDKASPAPASGPAGGPPPGAAPAGPSRGDQHGELDGGGSIYGALPASVDSRTAGDPALAAPASFTHAYGAGSLALAAAAPWTGASLNPAEGSTSTKMQAKKGQADAASPQPHAFAMGPGLSELGISVRGAPGIVDLDGPIGRSDGVDAPDSPSPTAASTRSFAANAGAAEAAPGAQADQLVDGADKGDAPLAPASNGPHPRVIDVSEGTPLDPLRDKTYDLNYAKTVPSAKQMVLPN
ncbi:Endolytic murein transglycosylase [Methylocella tundrae]|uniref:Endolytic murein transglycosylase n=1 Tax=Methylocella tundrae TaxID=227605 RepID=A0A8B6M4K9_METTU|nr:endolytic transglycosylase MltG [Methylocella tundrae]VTZ49726.1 Endolytic murein transglycosylase [Methylocella tundrae]